MYKLANEARVLPAAKKAIRNRDEISSSELQRIFGIGYATAAAIVDALDELGYIDPFLGSTHRRVRLLGPDGKPRPVTVEERESAQEAADAWFKASLESGTTPYDVLRGDPQALAPRSGPDFRKWFLISGAVSILGGGLALAGGLLQPVGLVVGIIGLAWFVLIFMSACLYVFLRSANDIFRGL
jgi:hypothetical protein